MSATQIYDPSAAYAAGRWIVTHHGLKLRLRNGIADAGESFTTLGEAQQAADARNGALS